MGGYINMVFILLENPVSANSEIQTGKKHENNGKVVLSVDMKSTCICQTKETDILWIYIEEERGLPGEGSTLGCHTRVRPKTIWMDNITSWTKLSVTDDCFILSSVVLAVRVGHIMNDLSPLMSVCHIHY